jgi:ATP-dependent RNA helicase DeaD
MNRIQFSELSISKEVLKAVTEMGFEEATPIQSMAIPAALTGKDIVGQAQTGTGKTAAFAIPMLETMDLKEKGVQALVLCPTRELAVQISEEVNKIAKFKRGLSILPVFGGQDIERQIRGLKKGAHVVIGTPGRVLDHLRRKTLKLDNLKMLILDEADEMLNMGFREDIETVLSSVDHDIQKMLFSATMPKEILNIINKYLDKPEMLKVAHKELTTPNITQVYLEVKDRDKLEILTRIVDINNFKLSIVFCNTKKRVDEVTDMLQARGYLCDKIHGDMKQTLRMNVINKFKRNDIELLVATDVAARGLDIDDVEAVFNFDIPSHEEYYVHRIGRTGRAGKEGSSFTFITYRDYHLLRSIQRYTKSEMKFYPIPKISDIEAMKQDVFLSKIKDRIEAGIDQKFVQMIENFIDDSFSAKEVAATLLQMELEMEEKKEIDSIDNNRTSAFKKTSSDRGDRRDNNRRDKDRGGKDRSRQGMARLHINVGNNHNVRVRDLVGAIANEASIEGSQIGSVDIFDTFSFVEIPEKHVERVMDRMKSSSIKGSPINIEIAKAKKKKVFGSKDYKKDGEHREKKRVKYKNPK